MRLKISFFILFISFLTKAQQLEFLYGGQQLNVYNALINDVPLFTQNFDDQVSSAISFTPFTIGGQAYNTLFVSTNGFLTLGQAASSTNYNPISQAPGMPVIAPFACNLESANNNARVSYQIVTGFNNVPNCIIVQWQNVRRVGMQGEAFSFQAKLNFTSVIWPGIEFIYGDYSSVNSTQTPIEIGIRIGTSNASTEFQNFQITNGGTWVPQQFGTSVNATCLFPSNTGSTGVPPSGMTHSWALLYSNNVPNVNNSPICNQNGNVVIYSNYDGGTLNINCDQNIPNLKIGISTYEPVIVNISGAFVGNVTEVLYAGFNSSQNNNHCGLGNITTSISGVNPSLVQILTAPPLDYFPDHQNGQAYQSGLMVGVSGQCDTLYQAGGGNTPDEVVAYFLNAFNGNLRFHHTSYNCWTTEIYDLSEGGTCCTDPFYTTPIWDIAISNDTSICFGESVNPLLLFNNNGIGPFTYSWTFEGQEVSQQAGFAFTPSASGLACLTVTDANADTLTECMYIEVNPLPIAAFTASDTLLCSYEVLTLNNQSSPLLGLNTTWLLDGQALSNQTNATFSPNAPGVYDITLIVNSTAGCSDTLTLNNYITVLDSPIAAFDFSPEVLQVGDQSIQLTDATLGQVDSWLWTVNFGNSTETSTQQNPVFSIPNNTSNEISIVLQVTNQAGCTSSATSIIGIFENATLFIPNAFTPDGNSLNQYFQIEGTKIDPSDFSMQIFNRWGELIFESKNIEIGWNGYYGPNNTAAQSGVYTYQVRYRFDGMQETETIRGHFSLLR
ncbi:MAG: gliding motility-associated C-terminal domain-containing protein [Sphingomonadales bacterium]